MWADECQKTFLPVSCVSRAVPYSSLQYNSTFGVLKVEELELAALLEGSGQIPQLAVDEGDDGALEERLGDALGDGEWGGLPRGSSMLLAIGKRDDDFLARFLYSRGQSIRFETRVVAKPDGIVFSSSRTSNFGVLSSLDLVEEVKSVLNELGEIW